MNPIVNAAQGTNLHTTESYLKGSSDKVQSNFTDTLKGAMENLNDIQLESDRKTEALAKGDVDNLHDVMITAQKASITLETTVQVQKKVIDAYNEIMRMQV
ncbi:flagellar hook-basal body complex protein FliE [Oceanobacillus halophilus]|uniref:Flagellar hook-basal body complex protein FliE n=1 Tax=Oceanobacillus halophilus TaxID=930130 RepID=A0A495ACZ0_9BACI|nr:flagellar hook-basal body complex protein FliE [Oceanobacillus halophilus]RKQ37480.1 flagellar hook-basal body complex protein FliE [Oceanobacillus halophilus]